MLNNKGVKMSQRDLKPLFLWAKKNGDANIYDRILIKIIPSLVAHNIKLTAESIESSESIFVSISLYTLVQSAAEGLIGIPYTQEGE